MFGHAMILVLAAAGAGPSGLSDQQKADLSLLLPSLSSSQQEPAAKSKLDRLMVLTADFDRSQGRQFQPTDPKAWRIIKTDRGTVYEQFQQSKYNPPYRSPFNFALLKDAVVEDFVLTAKLKSTIRDYPHRDLCLFFGYQDPAHFYYVHLGKRADANANQVMIVNKAPRVKITKKESPGTPWDDQWHEVKLVRRTQDGSIEVYFDDMKTPMLTAVDKTFLWGQVGIGSFDDTGMWSDVRLMGVRHAP